MKAVIEIQKSGDTATPLVQLFTDDAQAKSVYHQILATAALSALPKHSAVLMDDTGYTLKRDSYEHEVTA